MGLTVAPTNHRAFPQGTASIRAGIVVTSACDGGLARRGCVTPKLPSAIGVSPGLEARARRLPRPCHRDVCPLPKQRDSLAEAHWGYKPRDPAVTMPCVHAVSQDSDLPAPQPLRNVRFAVRRDASWCGAPGGCIRGSLRAGAGGLVQVHEATEGPQRGSFPSPCPLRVEDGLRGQVSGHLRRELRAATARRRPESLSARRRGWGDSDRWPRPGGTTQAGGSDRDRRAGRVTPASPAARGERGRVRAHAFPGAGVRGLGLGAHGPRHQTCRRFSAEAPASCRVPERRAEPRPRTGQVAAPLPAPSRCPARWSPRVSLPFSLQASGSGTPAARPPAWRSRKQPPSQPSRPRCRRPLPRPAR